MLFKNIKTATISYLCTLLIAVPAFAEGEAHEGGGGGLPQFDPTSWPSQLFWLAVFFTILYFVFGRSIIPALGNTIESRSAYIADHIRKAESLSAEAELLKKEMNASYNSAAQAAATQIAEADTAAKTKMASALTDFRTRYETQISATEQKITAAKQTALSDMEQIVIALSAQAAEKIAGIPASEAEAEGVVKSLSHSLGRKVA